MSHPKEVNTPNVIINFTSISNASAFWCVYVCECGACVVQTSSVPILKFPSLFAVSESGELLNVVVETLIPDDKEDEINKL